MLNKIIDIVKEAGHLFHSKIDVFEKNTNVDIVTNVDLAINHFLSEAFKNLHSSVLVVGEEDHNKIDFKAYEYVFIIDPIDGTKNFVRNITYSAISVGVFHNETLTYGVIYNPVTKDLYYANKGKGSFLNGKRITVSNKAFKDSLLCTGFVIYKKEYAKITQNILSNVYPNINDFRRFGSAALELAMVASGNIDLYFELRVFIWDFLAGYLLIEEAGGFIEYIELFGKVSDRKPAVLLAANTKENLEQLKSYVLEELRNYEFNI